VNERIALGTVQFGLPYGVANATGQIDRDEAARIVQLARRAGMDTIDTAIAYGESEQRLGELGVEGLRVVTKLPAFPDAYDDVAEWVRESIAGSLRRLRISQLAGLLLHQPKDLLGPRGSALYAALLDAKNSGLVEKIGVSIGAPTELDALASRFRFDLVQAPMNVVDRRLVASGWLARLEAAGTEIHVRSAFLQGLLLMDATNRPAKFDRWGVVWDQWQEWLASECVSPLESCLAFVLSYPEIDRVVVGADNRSQLEEILAVASTSVGRPPASLGSEDMDLVNPARWSAL
jgi:aryl-alcohol dehydrogenase-like predicted oxidoreductase